MRKFYSRTIFTHIMATNFYLDKRTDKKGDAPIRVSITIAGARCLTTTPLKCPPSKWDTAKQQCRKGISNGAGIPWNVINSELAKIAEHFASYEAQCISTGEKPDAAAIKEEFRQTFAKKRTAEETVAAVKEISFWDYWDMFTKERGSANTWTVSTYQKFNALKRHLQDFNKRLTFEYLDEAGLTKLLAHFRDKAGMRNVTIGKQYGYLKWFLNWATAKGYNTNIEYKTFSPKLKTTAKKVIFLEWEELKKVYNYEIPKNGTEVELTTADGESYKKTVHDASAIAKTRDIFCFCCFTSLRYSDAVNLKRADIDGEYMTITTVKTSDTIRIKLNKYALTILEKYKEVLFPNGCALPSITNQRMNIYLKDLCELCGLNQPITQTYYKGSERIDEVTPKYALMGTHAARRTFICNALMLGIAPQVVMKFTGHADYKSMKPYIDVTDQAQKEAMEKFNNL